MTPTILYPQHMYGFLTMINAPPDTQRITKAIQQWNSKELDDEAANAGFVLGLPVQPLSGIKSLSCTHVIAGTVAARTLAEYGANVLHIARDQSFEREIIVTDCNVGMRSSFVDLKNPAQSKAFATLPLFIA